jgi:hypothetical protein
LNYTFKAHDCIIFVLSYVFFALFEIDLSSHAVLPVELPAWIYLIIAFLLNAWVLPHPGIHPRLPKPEELPRLVYGEYCNSTAWDESHLFFRRGKLIPADGFPV